MDELNKIKKAIEKAKSEKSQAEGQLKVLNVQLNELGFGDVSEAIKEMKEMKAEAIETDKEIEDGTIDLQMRTKKCIQL